MGPPLPSPRSQPLVPFCRLLSALERHWVQGLGSGAALHSGQLQVPQQGGLSMHTAHCGDLPSRHHPNPPPRGLQHRMVGKNPVQLLIPLPQGPLSLARLILKPPSTAPP